MTGSTKRTTASKPVSKSEKKQVAANAEMKAVEKAPETAIFAPTLAQDAPADAKATNTTKTSGKAKAGRKGDAAKERAPRTNTKAATILEMIQRKDGATVEELTKAIDWQNHSVRGYISNLGRKQGLKVEAIKREDAARA